MTNDQFDALAKLLQLREGKAQEAARQVLVNGLSQADAGRAVGMPPNAVHNAVARCRRGLELARAATHPQRRATAELNR